MTHQQPRQAHQELALALALVAQEQAQAQETRRPSLSSRDECAAR